MQEDHEFEAILGKDIEIMCQKHTVLVAHACNPSYSGGRDQEDCSSKPAWANSF
jgi:hypothetical protein